MTRALAGAPRNGATALPMPARFWSRVRFGTADECWEWQGTRLPFGYGRIHLSPERRHESAHRVSWELHNGPIPGDLYVLHRCDNPPCVNPDHLFLGTYRDNARDMAAKGRATFQRHPHLIRRGSRAHGAKLTEAQVREIRALYGTGPSQAELGRRYGVTQSSIYLIVVGRNWAHVA